MKKIEEYKPDFIFLMALLMSFVALSIDSILPALGVISSDLNITDPNDSQFIVSAIFLGMGFGLIFFGPFSDAFGRKKAIYLGIAIFIIGCFLSIFSNSFLPMILGRTLQGLGAASCRVITIAMLRDKFSGNKMAKTMSLVQIIFILVPALAPAIGQAILYVGNWRFIFIFKLILGILAVFWLWLRHEETLPQEKRIPFSFKHFKAGIKETLSNPSTLKFTLGSGLIYGSFVGYLSSSRQILQELYVFGDYFPLAFGVLALSIGAASYVNSKFVEKLGMLAISKVALKTLILISFGFLCITLITSGKPSVYLFFPFLMFVFFCLGILFGNFASLAIEPLGHIAGIANSVISSSQTLISVIIGSIIGYSYDHTVIPLIIGFTACSILSFSTIFYRASR